MYKVGDAMVSIQTPGFVYCIVYIGRGGIYLENINNVNYALLRDLNGMQDYAKSECLTEIMEGVINF